VEYHTKNPDIVTKHNFSREYLDYDISRQIELESYGYRFLRLNKFNLRPEQDGETKTDVLDRSLPPKAKWLKSIIAFVNGAGRELILVVDNKSRDIVGIENPL